ncbi:hypothetical protein BDD12DRAFT_883130 [Trichophaea hybrida]|nr:hypothetical protein BDD12DRAFT_883130 [Trichophaea hybrida]
MTLGDGHPAPVQAIADLASVCEKRRLLRLLSGLEGGLTPLEGFLSPDKGHNSQEWPQHKLPKPGDQGNLGTDEERIQLARGMSPDVDNNDSDDDWVRRVLAMSIKANEDKETNEERLQRALTMLMQGEKGREETGCVRSDYSPGIASHSNEVMKLRSSTVGKQRGLE